MARVLPRTAWLRRPSRVTVAGLAPGLGPFLVGSLVWGIGLSLGGPTGYAINPARDFGPRLLTVVAGFKNNGLTDGSGVFWVPIIGPILGGILGTALYDYGVRRFLPKV